VTTSLQYDQLNRLTEMGSQGPQGTVSSYQYTLGTAGNRTGVTELSGRTVNYTYDNLYRLTSETIAGAAGAMNGSLAYQYDAVGNRKTLNSTLPALVSGVWYYDANDRTTGITGDTYDNDGNTIWRTGVQNTYDFENHLVQHGGMKFVYDGDGNRVAKTAGGVTISFLVDTNNPTGYAQVLDELQSNSVVRSYSYGLELISETQLTDAAPPASPWITSWYGYDGHGSVRYLTDSTGAATDTYDYDAFGNLIASTGTTPNLYLFAGEQFDRDLGLYYNRARYLDTRLGRFWGMDTEEGDDREPLSLHKYLYAGASPVDRLDPSGHDFDLASLSITEGIGEDLDGEEAEADYTAKRAINTPVFDAYFVIGPSNFRSFSGLQIVHAFMFMSTIATGIGTRYDVGLENPYATFSSAVLGVSPGFVMQSPDTLVSVQAAPLTFTYKVASLSTLQWLEWQGAVQALPVDTQPVSVPYSLLNMLAGTNCIKWTVEAALAALAASKIGL
jgi:RHS repeat-associated protein